MPDGGQGYRRAVRLYRVGVAIACFVAPSVALVADATLVAWVADRTPSPPLSRSLITAGLYLILLAVGGGIALQGRALRDRQFWG